MAEIAGEYLKKGSQVYIEGKLQTRKWQDQSGTDRYTTEIVVNVGGVMQILGSVQDRPNSMSNQPPKHTSQPRQSLNEPPMDFDDDIPF